MSGTSRYATAVLALTAGASLFCLGRFSAQLSEADPWRVTAAQRPVMTVTGSSEQDKDSRPESLLPGETINVNTADAYDLQRLPGIGEKRAQDIIAYREEHGPFRTLDELTEVSGIGPGILEGLREYAAVGPSPGGHSFS